MPLGKLPGGLFGIRNGTATPGFAGGDPSQQDDSASLVEELLSQLSVGQPPEAPKQAGPFRQVLGSIGDSLTARASVLAGGGPPQIGAFAAQNLAKQAEYRGAKAKYESDQRDLNNEIAKYRIERARSAEDTAAKDASARSSAVFSDALIRKRQQEDDERDQRIRQEDAESAAQVATEKWKRDTAFELSKLGVPGLSDPSKLSVPDVINAAIGAEEKIAGVELSPEERLRRQQEIVESIDPNLKMTGVGFSTKDGVPNARFSTDPFKSLSVADARIAERLGVSRFNEDGTPRSPQDVSNEVSAIQKSNREKISRERDVRLGLAIKRASGASATVGEKALEHKAMLRDVNSVLAVLASTADAPGGPIAGNKHVPPQLRYFLVESFFDKKAVDTNRQVTIGVQGIFNRIAKIRSGAAVTKPEEIRLIPDLPTMADTKATMVAKLKKLKQWEEDFLDDMQGKFSLTDEDLEFVGSKLDDSLFIPAETEPGDIVIFGGEE